MRCPCTVRPSGEQFRASRGHCEATNERTVELSPVPPLDEAIAEDPGPWLNVTRILRDGFNSADGLASRSKWPRRGIKTTGAVNQRNVKGRDEYGLYAHQHRCWAQRRHPNLDQFQAGTLRQQSYCAHLCLPPLCLYPLQPPGSDVVPYCRQIEDRGGSADRAEPDPLP